jgi:hypothetical protein
MSPAMAKTDPWVSVKEISSIRLPFDIQLLVLLHEVSLRIDRRQSHLLYSRQYPLPVHEAVLRLSRPLALCGHDGVTLIGIAE